MNTGAPQPPLGATPEPSETPRTDETSEKLLASFRAGFEISALRKSFDLARDLETELATARAALALAEEQLHHEQNEARKASAIIGAAKVPTNGPEGSGKRQDLSVAQRIEKLVAALAQCEERLKEAKSVIAANDAKEMERTGNPFDSPQFELRQQLLAAEAVIKQITEGHPNAGLVCELRTRATAAEAKLAQCEEKCEELSEMVETADADAAKHYEDIHKESMAAVEAIRTAEGWGDGVFASVRERIWWIAATRTISSLTAAHAKALERAKALEEFKAKLGQMADGYERAAGAEVNEQYAQEAQVMCDTIRDAIRAASAPATTGNGGAK